MTELRYDSSAPFNHHQPQRRPGGADAWDADTVRPFFLATDWKQQAGSAQSGLAYRWRDGLPLLEKWTSSQAVQLIGKRGVDVALTCLALLFLFPLLMWVALAIKLTSPGPVFFRQERVGLAGKSFRIFKFRTMYVDRGDLTGRAQTVANDDRVTPLGRFLRAKSIDELPQLINVLLGDMSLVGPRPHVEGMLAGGVTYETLVPYYSLRNAMPPGLTGWAQANGYRGPTDDAELALARVDHDLAYIQNFSLWLDFRIIFLTAWTELTRGTGV